MKNIRGAELRSIVESNSNVEVIDVRTSEEIQAGMIKGAKNINIMDPSFPVKIKELDRNKTYIMVCRSGNRSGSACGFMESEGFTDLYNLAGGMMDWDGDVV